VTALYHKADERMLPRYGVSLEVTVEPISDCHPATAVALNNRCRFGEETFAEASGTTKRTGSGLSRDGGETNYALKQSLPVYS
jgi:hypothetical protein